MPEFQPRPFPPSALADVPEEYIVDQLHSLADEYWNHPETADCTIIIPVPQLRTRRNFEDPDLPPAPIPSSNASSRCPTDVSLRQLPRITMNLHMDYLLANSTLLRGLFSDDDSVNLDPHSLSSMASSVPADRRPKLMAASTATHPVLLLPIPDPLSVHLLVHWMYFGTFELIADALTRRSVQWEGIARNVEYLCLSNDLKVFLGRWYANWLRPAQDSDDERSDNEDSETAYSVDEDEDNMMADFDSETDVGMESPKTENDPTSRGRDRATRCLSWTSTHSSVLETSIEVSC
ncbi:hypothetical protein CYLTODRAFT_346674 [Cylindrobasidium torrendii FP15055 ss-10]|uniref:Uncharacterized protein n=1 Tax=Cylindrobasidium torrendii FP15055 ss-10 TaxID=1314674 RepID=A0A0D7BLK8_9AGAR|nr:hypothetical protein CYLTODRAFT_346674 [Cylindrobasidium torrendii FP15055 ss-10]